MSFGFTVISNAVISFAVICCYNGHQCRKTRNLWFHSFSLILEKLRKLKIFYFSGWQQMTIN